MYTTRFHAALSACFLCIATTLCCAQDLESGLITHFEFDEVSGNIAYDSSVSDFDSQVLGGAAWAEGVLDGGIDFYGLDAKIDLGQPSEYDLTSFSISCWFKNTDATQFRSITARNTSSTNRQWWLTIWQIGYLSGRDAKLVFRMSPVSGTYVDLVSTTRVDDGQWHAAVVTIDSSNGGTARLYLDNVLQQTITGFGVPQIPNASAIIGVDTNAPNRFFQGTLDDLRIYNRVLSTEEISLLSEPPPQTFYVRTQGSDSNDGASPSTAFRTIQHAIDNCTRAGSTVYVGPGTYTESIEIGTGGGANAVSGTTDNPTQLIADTEGEFTLDSPGAVIIDGQSSQSTAITASGITDWIIDNFTIQNFTTYGIQASSAGLSVLNCSIEVPRGYAIYAIASGDFVVADCEFVRTTDSLHLIWITPSNTTDPTSVTITRNDGTYKDELYGSNNLSGGFSSYSQNRNSYSYGIIVYALNTAMIDTIEISNNQLSDFYLPLYCYASTSTGYEGRIQNNTITESLYSIYSYTQSGGRDYILNNIIDNSYYGLLTYTRNGGTQTVSGLMEHAITYDMSRLSRPYESSILTSSPIFTDAQAGDFSLRGRSKAIDAGSSLFALATDIAGNPRPVDGDEDEIAIVDLGAYEIVTEPLKLRMVQWREIGADAERFVEVGNP